MKKWGFLKEGTTKERNDEEGNRPSYAKDMDLDEGHEHSADCGCPDMEEGMKYRDEDTGSKEHNDEEGNRPSYAKDMDLKEDSEGEETYHYGEAEGHDEKELHDLVNRHATKAHIDALKRDMDYDEDHEDRRERGDHFREGAGDWSKIAQKKDPTDLPGGMTVLDRAQIAKAKKGPKVRGKGKLRAAGGDNIPAKIKLESDKVSPKISVREAKEITRRIIERIKLENK
jgi:hypothetical protein